MSTMNCRLRPFTFFAGVVASILGAFANSFGLSIPAASVKHGIRMTGMPAFGRATVEQCSTFRGPSLPIAAGHCARTTRVWKLLIPTSAALTRAWCSISTECRAPVCL